MRDAVKMIRSKGTGGDSVLAHISPREAHSLARDEGYDINPYTGLPQFGLFKKILRPVEKVVRRVIKPALPVIGSVIGNMVAPGIGTAIGGGLGGALSSKNHKFEHALFGAAMSPLVDRFVAPAILGGFGKSSEDSGDDSFGSGLGRFSAKALRNIFKSGSNGSVEQDSNGFGSKVFDELTNNPLNTALGATAILGLLNSKQKPGEDFGPSYEEQLIKVRNAQRNHGGPLYKPYRKPKPISETRKYIAPTKEDLLSGKPFQYFDDVNPDIEYYAAGGHVDDYDEDDFEDFSHVSRYLDGHDGGQDDNIIMSVKPDSYVMNSTVTSLIGDGNTKNGKKKFKKWEKKVVGSGKNSISSVSDGRTTKIAVSDGEHIFGPDFVEKIGGGSKKKGGKILDNFQKNVIKHKGLKNFLPPKSKPIESYLRGK